MTIGERIKNRRKELGLSVDDVAEKLEKNRATIYRYESNEIEKLPTTVLEPLSKVLGVTPAYLMGWDEEPSTAPNSPQAQELTLLDNKKIRMIPVYNSVSAGFGAYADECRVGFMPIYIENDYDAENMLAINVKGDSMYPKIEDGDTIVVRKQKDFENGDIVVVLIDRNEGLVKKIFAEKDKVTLVSINPEYKDRVFEGAEIERLDVVGVVKKLVKDI